MLTANRERLSAQDAQHEYVNRGTKQQAEKNLTLMPPALQRF